MQGLEYFLCEEERSGDYGRWKERGSSFEMDQFLSFTSFFGSVSISII
jgi:hypothetical protein